MSKFYSALKLILHVSDLICPSSGAFCTSCIRRLWYVAYQSLRIQLVQNALDDGQMRSETCRTNLSAE